MADKKLDPDEEITEPYSPYWPIFTNDKDEIDIDEAEIDLTIEEFLKELKEELDREECECGAYTTYGKNATHSTWCPSYKKDK
jgi:hypothetical protein